MTDVTKSKFLSLVLRHQPELIGLILDESGWVEVDTLLRQSAIHGKPLTQDDLARLIATSDKQRFALSEDGKRIRANQGHSVQVNLGLVPQAPPDHLFHGTATRFLDSIRAAGLQKQARHHVHLSAEKSTATAVGKRHGHPALLLIKAGEMHRAGHASFLSENGVWLVDHVPVSFVEFP